MDLKEVNNIQENEITREPKDLNLRRGPGHKAEGLMRRGLCDSTFPLLARLNA